MIGKLSGYVDCCYRDHLILMVQGVGYVLWASAKTLSQIPESGEPCMLWVEHIFKQDSQQLCGFFNEKERTCFRLLMDVQGVGVRVALAILSTLTPYELAQAILSQDKTLLTRADGVGPKLAGRLVLELKDKALQFSDHEISLSALNNQPIASTNIQDAISGLIALGYSRTEAVSTLNDVAMNNNDASTQDLIRLSLQKLARI